MLPAEWEKLLGIQTRFLGVCHAVQEHSEWCEVFCLVEETLAGEWTKPLFAWAWLGAVRIHPSGIDSVVVGAVVVLIVLFFGRLKY